MQNLISVCAFVLLNPIKMNELNVNWDIWKQASMKSICAYEEL